MSYIDIYNATLGKSPRDSFFLNILSAFQSQALHIFEVGCSSVLTEDGKDKEGWSSMFWADYIYKHGGKLTICDTSIENIEKCKILLDFYIQKKINICFVHGHGEQSIPTDVDLLYLDGSDSLWECFKQFERVNTDTTTVICNNAHIKGVLTQKKNTNFIKHNFDKNKYFLLFPSKKIIPLLQNTNQTSSFTNEILQTQKLTIIERNGEKILPVVLYGENRNPEVLEWNKKVYNYLGITMNYLRCPFPHVSHGKMIDEFIKSTLNLVDYWIFMENDSIILKKDAIDLIYDKIKDKNTVFGGAHQSNHKRGPNGEMNHPYVGPSLHCISKALYFKLGCPKYDDVNVYSDTAEQITYECEKLGYNVCIVWPRSVTGLTLEECQENSIDPQYQFSDLGNGQKFGFGTTYGDIYYHQMCAGVKGHNERFINKCQEIILQ